MRPDTDAPRLRLLLVTHYFPAHRGGVEIVAFELARRLAKHVQLHWMAADCDPPPQQQDILTEGQSAWNGLEHHLGLPWPIWHPRGWLQLKNAIKQADVVHLHEFIYPASIAAFLLARQANKPMLITQHIGDIQYRSAVLRVILRTINRSVGRFMLGRVDQVVFVSPKVQQLFSTFTHFANPAACWPNGVDGKIFYPLPHEKRRSLRAALGLDEGRKVILFVGRFVEKKGLPLIREVIGHQSSELQWWFAGWGSQGNTHPGSWNLRNVKVWADRRGVSLAELYQAADVLILPSHGEGFPLVIQESLACGTPVLTSTDTAAGGPNEPRFIIPIPGTPDAPRPTDWANALTRLLDAPPANRQRLRDSAAAFACTAWNWDHLADNYLTRITELRHKRLS